LLAEFIQVSERRAGCQCDSNHAQVCSLQCLLQLEHGTPDFRLERRPAGGKLAGNLPRLAFEFQLRANRNNVLGAADFGPPEPADNSLPGPRPMAACDLDLSPD